MNPVVEEMKAILMGVDEAKADELMHYGMPRRSGRYPWGSGEDPYQHNEDFLSRVDRLKKSGWKETAENIQKEFGVGVKEYRMEKTWCNYERRLYQVEAAKSMKSDGLGETEIGRKLGVPESTVRSYLNAERESRMKKVVETKEYLKQQVDEKKMVDVGKGVEIELGISKEKLDTALYALEGEGYHVYGGRIPQLTNPGQQTTQRVLCVPEKKHSDIWNYEDVKTLNEYTSHDGGKTFDKFVYPKSMDSKRLAIRYDEDGGTDRDGIVEIRRGVKDLSLGDAHYAQVRILVDDKKYIKGMAVYSDDLPDGVDVLFNTNKSNKVAKMDVLKDIKKDPDNPFGALIEPKGQSYYEDSKGNKQLSLINKTRNEGDWTDWTDTLPSQFLGKQSRTMAKKQLDLAKADKLAEYDNICSLENPTLKKYYLKKFADSCDSAAVQLKGAALPGQKYHVIIPINTLKDNEVYAPRYENGTQLALIRYPHAGTFEIPVLTVNNKHMPAKKLIGNTSIDAIGITKANADRLSGADFDGDTVMCIPTNDKAGKVKIKSTQPLEGLKDFDPKLAYGHDKKIEDADGTTHYYRNGSEYKIMKDTDKQMGVISNLITDMTLAGASSDELARAVRHSMVVIDAEKHKLDYKASEVENNIAALHKDYQGKATGGAATLLSRAKGQEMVEKRQGTPKINMKGTKDYDPTKPEGAYIYKKADDLYYAKSEYNKNTGEYTLKTADGKTIKYNKNNKEDADYYRPIEKKDPVTGEVYFTNKTGDITYKRETRKIKSTRMAERDPYELVSEYKHPMELIYADYASSMKALGNTARKELMTTGKIEYDKNAANTYKKEVASLNKKLNDAEVNKIREREALRRANVEVREKTSANEDMSKKDRKKLNQQATSKYRSEVGSVSRRDRSIFIDDREWEAIQAGAISENKLKKILDNTDVDNLRQRAMPRANNTLSTAKINKAKMMANSNFSLADIAASLGVSPSTVSKYLKGAK